MVLNLGKAYADFALAASVLQKPQIEERRAKESDIEMMTSVRSHHAIFN